ncbi:MAG: LytR C-terminal domain-containing protein, partial [Actinobacteria bacterium]|nr:LytR C-terminal domain-containing protein [Actinomycetota bacterium]
FDVTEVGDARSRVDNTVVSYADGALAKAELIAAYIGGATDLRAEPTLSDVDVELVTGGTFAGIQVPGSDEPPADAPVETAPVEPECLP